jgi:hypothetical protein
MKEVMEAWRKILNAVENEDNEEEELEEWNAEDDDDYPSRQKRKKDRKMLKPSRGSWVDGYDDLKTLAKGKVGLDTVSLEEAKKAKKKQCHAYQAHHGVDGKFVNPEKEKGSYSMKAPDSDSPDDCTWGKARRNSANRSRQSTQQPCGRDSKYRCKDGSKKYQERLELFEAEVEINLHEGDNQQLEIYLAGVIDQAVQKAVKTQMASSGCSFQQLIRAMTAWSNAEKGGKK